MSQYGKIRRYTLIIEKIQGGQYPSVQKISDYLIEHGFDISHRTLQRDFKEIRDEFGIEITYNKSKSGYFIDQEQSIEFEGFMRFLEIVNTAELLTESLQESKESLQHISFDMGGGLKGIEYLKPLLQAIRDKRKISFQHYNFHTEKRRRYSLKPYLLKEYENRWYIIGQIGNLKGIRTFGIDRIDDLEVLTETFTPKEDFFPEMIFNNTIGLIYSMHEVQDVVLSFSATQGKYIQALPMHSSQKVITDNEDECRISLKVAPNYELTQQILKHGKEVKILEPQWLKTEIKNIIEEMIKHYQ